MAISDLFIGRLEMMWKFMRNDELIIYPNNKFIQYEQISVENLSTYIFNEVSLDSTIYGEQTCVIKIKERTDNIYRRGWYSNIDMIDPEIDTIEVGIIIMTRKIWNISRIGWYNNIDTKDPKNSKWNDNKE